MDYPDSYYARTIRETTDYPPLTGDLEVETLVIGGGLAGCATALDLAERGRPVAVLEAHRIGWGASGRNGGFASEGFPKGYMALTQRVGRSRAQEIQRVARTGLGLVRQRIADYAIECGPNQEGALRCNLAGRGDDLIGLRDFLAETFGVVHEYWPRERVREALSAERYSDALFVPTTIAVHPLNLTLGLARACVERGGQVFQNSAACAISDARGRIEVRTARGRIRADRVVVTCGGYVGRLQRRLSMATIPIATFVMATEPLGALLSKAIRVPYAIYDNQVDVAWSGMMPMTRHRFPVIGQVAPNVWYVTGLGGLGVALSSAFGRLIAAALVEGDETWRLFEAFGLPNGGGQLGRVPAQLVYWWHRMRAGVGQRPRSQ
jgi:gamma-glutamylputrescine oxidase